MFLPQPNRNNFKKFFQKAVGACLTWTRVIYNIPCFASKSSHQDVTSVGKKEKMVHKEFKTRWNLFYKTYKKNGQQYRFELEKMQNDAMSSLLAKNWLPSNQRSYWFAHKTKLSNVRAVLQKERAWFSANFLENLSCWLKNSEGLENLAKLFRKRDFATWPKALAMARMLWEATAAIRGRCLSNKKMIFLLFALLPLTTFAFGPEEVSLSLYCVRSEISNVHAIS